MYPDLKNTFGVDNVSAAVNHYVNTGVNEGRSPNPFFDPKFYLSKYPDLVNAFGPTNYSAAWDHWNSNGFNEGRQGSPYFDVGYYLSSNADLVAAFGAGNFVRAFNHWKEFGWAENRATAQGGNLKLYPYLGTASDPNYVLVQIIHPSVAGAGGSVAGTILNCIWLVMSIMGEAVQHANQSTLSQLQQDLAAGRAKVAAAQWLNDNDRSNFESEHYEETRDTMEA